MEFDKNGDAAVLSDELEGSLTDAGGKIASRDRGVVLLTGCSRRNRRTFEASQTVTVYRWAPLASTCRRSRIPIPVFL
jgi:hypothetical protein